MHWELKTFHRAAFCQGMCERSANVPQQHLGLCANVDISRTWHIWHGAAIISWALWSPRALAKASCSVGFGPQLGARLTSGNVEAPCPLELTEVQWPGGPRYDAPTLLIEEDSRGWCVFRWLYYIIYYIILIYTLYTWVASHRFCCRTCHVLRHGSKLPSIRRPLLRIRSTGFVTRKRPRSDSVLADRRTGFWLLSCGSLSSLGSLATCESASCTTSALWILLDGLWWFMLAIINKPS